MIAALNNLDSMIDKYQTIVFSTTCDSPIDVVSDSLKIDHMCRRFVVMSFFSVAAVAYGW